MLMRVAVGIHESDIDAAIEVSTVNIYIIAKKMCAFIVGARIGTHIKAI